MLLGTVETSPGGAVGIRRNRAALLARYPPHPDPSRHRAGEEREGVSLDHDDAALDGFTFHGSRSAFSYDRLRQNDLHAAGWLVVRFSYDMLRLEPARCVAQLQSVLNRDPLLADYVIPKPFIEQPDMDPDPLFALTPAPRSTREVVSSYFDSHRNKLHLKTLRQCQTEAFAALGNYFRSGGTNAACVMSVGAGKTALGVVTCLAFTRRRALGITPRSVIRGTFDKAFDHPTGRNL